MNILQICHKVPFPPRDGGSIAMYNLARGLLDLGNDLKVLAIQPHPDPPQREGEPTCLPDRQALENHIPTPTIPKWGERQRAETPRHIEKEHDASSLHYPSPSPPSSDRAGTSGRRWSGSGAIETVYIDTSVKVWDAFINLFSSESYHIKRFISNDFENKLIEVLKNGNFDIIQLESLFVTPYINCIRKYSNAKVVLRAHNIEFEIWERMTAVCNNPVKKAYLKLLTKRLRHYELNQLNSYDGILAITHRDEGLFKEMGCKLPIIDIPIGMDLPDNDLEFNKVECETKFITRPLSLFHLGSMDWMPNQEAIKWFLDNIWMKIHRKFPDLEFHIAGKNMPKWLKNIKYNNVEIVGEAGDAKQFMQSKSIMIVPLLSGSGMRVKIIEGMALGKTIISTSVGAEGIKYEHLKNILIANSPTEFLEMIGKCMEDNSLCDKIGENARLLINEHYNNIKISEKLVGFYESLLR